jgi:hypothetical protein
MTSDDDSDRRIKTMTQQANERVAVHEVRLVRLEEDMAEIKADIKAMREILSEARGSWRTLVMIGGACGTIGAAVSWAVSHLSVKA